MGETPVTSQDVVVPRREIEEPPVVPHFLAERLVNIGNKQRQERTFFDSIGAGKTAERIMLQLEEIDGIRLTSGELAKLQGLGARLEDVIKSLANGGKQTFSRAGERGAEYAEELFDNIKQEADALMEQVQARRERDRAQVD